jgi:hypothetical protein
VAGTQPFPRSLSSSVLLSQRTIHSRISANSESLRPDNSEMSTPMEGS